MDRTEKEPSVYFMRVCLQEVLQTLTFTMVFLALRYTTIYKSSSTIIKGITLYHVLWACYALSMGAGACLNPALAIAQTVYWVGLAAQNGHDYNPSCLWIYTIMPFVGAFIAYLLFDPYKKDSDSAVAAARPLIAQQAK
jgi:glycerol uptake facilitator-like aquaporin